MGILKQHTGLILALLTDFMIILLFVTNFFTFRDFEGVNIQIYWIISLLYIFIATSAIGSHLICIFKNPGIMPDKVSNKSEYSDCPKCSKPKNLHIHHCSRCKVCIYKMDHHCHWINNCVGYYNQTYYIIFLISIGLFCGFSLILIVFAKIYCGLHPDLVFCIYNDKDYFIELAKILSLGISLFFLAFVSYLLSDQIESIRTNSSQIDRLKIRSAQNFNISEKIE